MNKLILLISLLMLSHSLWSQTVVCKRLRSMPGQAKFGVLRTSDNVLIGERMSDSAKCEKAAEIANWTKNDIVCGYQKTGRTQGYYLYRISDLKILSNLRYQTYTECDASIAYSRPGRVCVRHQAEDGRIGFTTVNIALSTRADDMIYDHLSMCYENIDGIEGKAI